MTHPPLDPAQSRQSMAKPHLRAAFDPWNSSSTGHQRPETNTGRGWRQSRAKKLNGQYEAGRTGGVHVSDTWGHGSEDWDKEMGAVIPKSSRERKGRSVKDMLLRPGLMPETLKSRMLQTADAAEAVLPHAFVEDALVESSRLDDHQKEVGNIRRAIFNGVVVYVNGSSYPLVSDHKLKHMLSEHGAKLSLHLGRRQVTHVIVGRPIGSSYGAGGGLAGTKLEKEIRTARGSGVVFVGAEWILESIKAGKRLPETRFATMSMASRTQSSVYRGTA